MIKNDFKEFATGKSANVISQNDWEVLPVLDTGFTSGKASSAQINKVLRQTTFVSSALAQLVADTLSQDVLDNGNRNDFTGKIKSSIINLSIPVGVPLPWPNAIPPDGWLKCNGAKFDKNLYPILASVYPSGILPDLRGEFIRGWDDARGIDSGRNLLSTQDSANAQHMHTLKNASISHSGTHNHSGTTSDAGNHNHSGLTDTAGNHTHTANVSTAGKHNHNYNDLFNSFGTEDWDEQATHMDHVTTPDTYIASGTSDSGATIFPYMSRTTDVAGDHQHTVTISPSGNHQHNFSTNMMGNHNHTLSINNSGDHTHSLVGNTDLTGTESRPRNIAFNYIVRAA